MSVDFPLFFFIFWCFFVLKLFYKNKKSLKNFGGSRGSKGQGSNPNNRINDFASEQDRNMSSAITTCIKNSQSAAHMIWSDVIWFETIFTWFDLILLDMIYANRFYMMWHVIFVRQLIVSRFGFQGANSTHHGSQLCLPKHAQATANMSQTFVGKHVIVAGS